jgi:hypothetical protein
MNSSKDILNKKIIIHIAIINIMNSSKNILCDQKRLINLVTIINIMNSSKDILCNQKRLINHIAIINIMNSILKKKIHNVYRNHKHIMVSAKNIRKKYS